MSYPIFSIDDVCIVGDGAHAKIQRLDRGVPYLTSKNIKKGYLDLNKVDYISESDYQKYFSESKSSVRNIRDGDVLIGIIGTFGNCYRYKQEDHFGISSSIAILRPKLMNVIPDFLYYYVSSQSFYDYLEAAKGGSVQGYTNLKVIRGAKLPLPSLKVQKSIVDILSSLDAKIELNQRMNQTLEDMAITLYKHWFVDFGHVIDGEFDESLLGKIPKGWTVRSVYELATFVNGKAFKQTHLNEQKMGLPVIKISELNANSIKNAKFYEGEYQEKYRLNTGDVLFAWSASLGIYLWTHGEALLNQHIFNVQPNGTYSKSFLYFLLKYVINEFKDIAAARATTMGHIKKEHLQSRYVPYPTVDFLRKTEDIFADLYSKILANEVENNYLKETRDYLLPRLLSGEIELKEAEKQVEEML